MQTDKTKIVRSWLLKLLSDMEMNEIKDASKRESGNKIIIEIELDY
jgi:hypothetical protein